MSVQTEITRLEEAKAAIAAAIAGKEVTVPDGTKLDAMAALIDEILTGVDTSDATATADSIVSGYTAYVGGEKITGTIPTKAAATITPGTSAKTAVSAGYYTTGAVKVAGDSNLVADNIKSGIKIFGVTGTYAGLPTDISALNHGSYTPTADVSSSKSFSHNLGIAPNFYIIYPHGASSAYSSFGYGYFLLGMMMGKTYVGSDSTEYSASGFYRQGGNSNWQGYHSTFNNGETPWDETTFTLTLNSTRKLKAGVKYYWVCGHIDTLL